MKIVTPKRYIPISPFSFLIFLAGPVQGGGDWQRYFIERFINVSVPQIWTNSFTERVLPRIRFIVPCRWDETHPLSGYFVTVYEDFPASSDDLRETQTCWEFHYLDQITSSNKGIVVYGLFPEDKENPRADGRPYAMDTFGEIGRWVTTAHFKENDCVILGCHQNFVGLQTIHKNLRLQFGDDDFVDSFCWVVNNPEELADLLANQLSELYAKDADLLVYEA